jgi:hypothetical protein
MFLGLTVAALKVLAVDAPAADDEHGAALAARLAGRKVGRRRRHDVPHNGRVLALRLLLLGHVGGERALELLVRRGGAGRGRVNGVVRRTAVLGVAKVHGDG